MAQNIGVILTKKKTQDSEIDEINCGNKENNQVTVAKAKTGLSTNLEALRHHQKAKLDEIQRQQEKILALTSNRTIAEQRGKHAEQVLRQKQHTEAFDSQKLLNARMAALKVERERAGFIASLPPFSKESAPLPLDKFQPSLKPEKRRYFESIREPISQQSDARVEALKAQSLETISKETRRKRVEAIDDKNWERFNQALEKEQILNCQNEVVEDLDNACRADRQKQQQKLIQESLPPQVKKNQKTLEINNLEDKNSEESSEKAVKELGVNLGLGISDADSFVTRRKQKKGRFNETTLDFQNFERYGNDWMGAPHHSDADSFVTLRKQKKGRFNETTLDFQNFERYGNDWMGAPHHSDADSFVTLRKPKKGRFNETTLDFQNFERYGNDWMGAPHHSGHFHSGLYLNDDTTIQNGMNVTLQPAIPPPDQHQQDETLKITPTRIDCNTKHTATIGTQSPEKLMPESSLSSSSSSFASLPHEFNTTNNPLTHSMLQKYERHLILQGKTKRSFPSPKYAPNRKNNPQSSSPSTNPESISSSTTIGSSNISQSTSNPPEIIMSPGTSTKALVTPNVQISPTTVGTSSIASSTPKTTVETQEKTNETKAKTRQNKEEQISSATTSTTSSSSTIGSSVLSTQIKKVLEKYIGDDPRTTFKFEPKRPERFFKEIKVSDPKTYLEEFRGRKMKKAVHHRIFPEMKDEEKQLETNKEVTDDKVDGELTIQTKKQNYYSEEPTNENVSTESSQSSKSSSSIKSFTDSKTKTLPQSLTSDFKIPTYIQHKFLTGKLKSGEFDVPIETIDDLREILAILPSGHNLEDCIRVKPPVSYPHWVDEENEPHELSTIPEVDTPQTSINCSRELIFPKKGYENPSRSAASGPFLIASKSGGFFKHLSLEDSKSAGRSTPEPLISNANSTKSTCTASNEVQTRWGDLLKQNYKPKSGMASNTASRLSNISPNLDEFDLQRAKCQSTPVKEQDVARNSWDEDLMAVNLTLIGPEITVSSLNQTAMSESLSFLKETP